MLPAHLIALAFLAASSPASATEVELLPDVTLRLEGARYEPTDTDLHWDTWIGAGAGLVRFEHTTLDFQADVETTAGNTRRAFDATQANYHLEPALRVDLGKAREVELFFHHVSRHQIDTLKAPAVEWNVVGVRGTASLPGAPVRFTASLGRVAQEATIGYQWEVVGRIEADLLRRPWGAAYLITVARGVTTESSPAFPREGFIDFLLEGGVRYGRESRTAQLFLAYEHRNDVLVLEPGYRDRALIGFRFGLRSATPPP